MAAEDEDKINKLPDEAPQGEGNTIEAKKYTEQELKDMKEQFMMFDDDAGGGLTAEELERRRINEIFLIL